ncbi:MAG: hypothetical protein K0U41_01765 [Gammaproteobacteria bacterium]|nr:hypothetical protein [Gammaproteobacteria bacterium]
MCHNTIGSFECLCSDGYVFLNEACTGMTKTCIVAFIMFTVDRC